MDALGYSILDHGLCRSNRISKKLILGMLPKVFKIALLLDKVLELTGLKLKLSEFIFKLWKIYLTHFIVLIFILKYYKDYKNKSWMTIRKKIEGDLHCLSSKYSSSCLAFEQKNMCFQW